MPIAPRGAQATQKKSISYSQCRSRPSTLESLHSDLGALQPCGIAVFPFIDRYEENSEFGILNSELIHFLHSEFCIARLKIAAL